VQLVTDDASMAPNWRLLLFESWDDRIMPKAREQAEAQV
jgi:hypothetical protein